MKGFPDVIFNRYGFNILSASQQQQPKHLLLLQRENRRVSIIRNSTYKNGNINFLHIIYRMEIYIYIYIIYTEFGGNINFGVPITL